MAYKLQTLQLYMQKVLIIGLYYEILVKMMLLIRQITVLEDKGVS